MQLYNISSKGELIEINRLEFQENDVYLVDDEEKNTIFIWVGLQVPQAKKDITADIARKIDKERGGSAKILIMKQKREYGSFLAMMHNLERGLIPGKTVKRRPEFVLEAPPEEIESVGLDGKPEMRELTVEARITKWLQQIKDHRVYKQVTTPIEASATIKFIKFEHPDKKDVKVKPQPLVTFEKETIKEPFKEEIIEEKEEVDFEKQIREAAYYLSLKGFTYDQLCWILAEKIQKMTLDMPSIEDIRVKAEQVFNSSCTYDELCWLNAEMDILTRKSYLEK
ncbi:MAG: hypothetical protein ACFFG0_31490 [Candidatus Thorarchaeota archaeon]